MYSKSRRNMKILSFTGTNLFASQSLAIRNLPSFKTIVEIADSTLADFAPVSFLAFFADLLNGCRNLRQSSPKGVCGILKSVAQFAFAFTQGEMVDFVLRMIGWTL
jgi:hypothetical protein